MKRIVASKNNQDELLNQAKKVLEEGGLVLYPTETVYGAGVDATNQKAVDKLLQYKSRREGKPLSIAVTDQAMAEQFVTLNEQAQSLYNQFLPGPMTVISTVKSTTSLAIGVASEFNSLGIRISSHPLVEAMVATFGKPITATSANASGKRRPYSVAQILDHLSEKQKKLIDLIIDAGTLPSRPPSTVIDTTLSTPVVFRQGQLFQTATTSTKLVSSSETETKQIAGKLLLKHWDRLSNQPVIFALNGPLGAGKTIFAKGIAEFLGMQTTLASPTYTYIEEYGFTRGQTSGLLHHIDVWKVDSAELFERLEIEKLLLPNTVLVIEWFAQVADWLRPHLKSSNATVVEVVITDQADKRELAISEAGV